MMPRKLVVLTTSLTGGAIGLSSLCRWLAASKRLRVRPEWGELLAPDCEIIRLGNRGHPIQK
jgi:hypothetical protein